ncbi:MAG: SAM-dependent methyltransferase, partial [Waddliaceae bacterium]|nr:SAM-dependent methyltransferase [Waddliaceae bacterium]
ADGERWGYVSDAGLPCIADPGNELVNGARAKGFDVEAYSGPSSIFLALMLSGLQGQRFTFHGYISKEKEQRENEMKDMEAYAQECHATQIFIEAPYRNVHTFQSLIEVLGDETLLCVACDLTLPTQEVICRCVGHWKKTTMPDIAKKPAIFLIA